MNVERNPSDCPMSRRHRIMHRCHFVHSRSNPVPTTSVLMMFNLTQIREKVFAKIIDIMDKDGNNKIGFNEFCEVMMAKDALPLLRLRKK